MKTPSKEGVFALQKTLSIINGGHAGPPLVDCILDAPVAVYVNAKNISIFSFIIPSTCGQDCGIELPRLYA